jgi:hypothetical protein
MRFLACPGVSACCGAEPEREEMRGQDGSRVRRAAIACLVILSFAGASTAVSEKTIVSFDGTDGLTPDGSLLFDVAGNLTSPP